MSSVKCPKKLIEVALPLDAINEACAHEKQPGIGAHPRGLHLWWARRPLAAARAVLFAQLVNDPGYERQLQRGVNKEQAAKERERLFGIIERLVQWENSNNEALLEEARAEIWKSWRETCELNKSHPDAAELFNPEKLPDFHDPFAGGGAIPLEAQRLGLESYASDLNPVAVTINKAMIEIPPKFAGRSPVGPKRPNDKQARISETWQGISGLAEDVLRYGAWIRREAEQRVGRFYPKIEVTEELAKERPDLSGLTGEKLPVLTWIWARTVKSPNPAYSHVDVPLISTFILSSKSGKEAYVAPSIEGSNYRLVVKVGTPPEGAAEGTKAHGNGANFFCLVSGTPIGGDYIKTEGQAGRIGTRLLATIANGRRGRVYLNPTEEQEDIARQATPGWQPDVEFFQQALGFRIGNYGFTTWSDLFTQRQMMVLSTFSDLVREAIEKCSTDGSAREGGVSGKALNEGGTGARAYAEALGVYLSFAIDRLADYGSSIATWKPSGEQVMQTYKRQALPMTWDFPESNLLGDKAISWHNAVKYEAENLLATASSSVSLPGWACQLDAQKQALSKNKIISTDPPYYDNIGYADLSDFFYVWLRKSLKSIFPVLFSTVAVPKADELVATPHRHGGKKEAESFFLNGMTDAVHNLSELGHPAFPVTIYYAFKQSETTDNEQTHSSGWETFLEAVLNAGFAITGTWPMRTELGNRMRGNDSNALASSIVLVCRKRASDAPTISRREFIRELNSVLPDSLLEMTGGGVNSPVAPVDLSQAMIGPGMAIFSKYSAVLESDGKPMSVRTALQLINRFLAEDDFDHDTQFCLRWFEGYGWDEGKYGEADVLARAKGTSVGGLHQAGVVESGGGNVRLLRWADLAKDWTPEKNNSTPIWEAMHQLIRALNQDGETAAGKLLAGMPMRAEPIRALAYRLYTLCERKSWAEDARSYNELIGAWSAIERAANESGQLFSQSEMF